VETVCVRSGKRAPVDKNEGNLVVNMLMMLIEQMGMDHKHASFLMHFCTDKHVGVQVGR
jgi:hypothetical protein